MRPLLLILALPVAMWLNAALPFEQAPAQNGGTTQPSGIGSGANTFTAAQTLPQIIGFGSTPTIANGPAAGTLPGAPTVAGTNLAGIVTIITGTATTPSSTLATITFNGTLASAPQGCALFPRNASAVGEVAMIYTTAPNTTTWTIAVAGSAVPISSTYSWSYSCF